MHRMFKNKKKSTPNSTHLTLDSFSVKHNKIEPSLNKPTKRAQSVL